MYESSPSFWLFLLSCLKIANLNWINFTQIWYRAMWIFFISPCHDENENYTIQRSGWQRSPLVKIIYYLLDTPNILCNIYRATVIRVLVENKCLRLGKKNDRPSGAPLSRWGISINLHSVADRKQPKRKRWVRNWGHEIWKSWAKFLNWTLWRIENQNRPENYSVCTSLHPSFPVAK